MTLTDCSDHIGSMYSPPLPKKKNAVPMHEKKNTEEYGTAHGWCSSPQAAR